MVSLVATIEDGDRCHVLEDIEAAFDVEDAPGDDRSELDEDFADVRAWDEGDKE